MTTPDSDYSPEDRLNRLRRIDALCIEFEKAWRDGKGPRIESYLQRMCEPDRPDLLRELITVEVELRREEGQDRDDLRAEARDDEEGDHRRAIDQRGDAEHPRARVSTYRDDRAEQPQREERAHPEQRQPQRSAESGP